MQKGDTLESKFSSIYHQKGLPFLVSPLVLRSQNLGQIDIAILEKNRQNTWVLKIIESKSSFYPSRYQLIRLRKTQDYLSRVLEIESKLEVNFCQKANDSLSF